jgi:hypothetical protein
MTLRVLAPGWGRLPTVVFVVMWALAVPALAKGRKRPKKPAAPVPIEQPAKPDKEKPDTDNSTATEPVSQAVNDKDAKSGDAKSGNKKIKEQTFNFEGLGLNGRNRSPQLLYFLERANEELERASLEKRSFIPHMVKSLEEEAL